MQCQWCGKQFRPRGPGQKYDSAKCRLQAWRAAKKNSKKAAQTEAKTPKSKPKSRKRKSQKTVAVPVSKHVEAVLTKGAFDTLMTAGMDEALPFTANILKKALADPDTPANALAAISREYLAIIEKIDSRKTPDLLAGIDDTTSEDAEVDTANI